ncbi:hypothetical protein [Streptomyces pristinaespiralis]|uniref:hypothetical protein n=1 Tax=Streptomyces pristinaespiralis TaxID=38300 RepID=UPI0033D89F07
MDLHDLIDLPGERQPLLTLGEAHALVVVLEELTASAVGDIAAVAAELRARLAMRLPSSP